MKQLLFFLLLALSFLNGISQAGMLDKTFGENGILTVSNSDIAGQPQASALLKDNKIVVVNVAYINKSYTLLLSQLLPDGQPDTSFGTLGKTVITSIIFGEFSIVIQNDDKIVIAGSTQAGFYSAIILLRFTPDGYPDSSFGINGIVIDSSRKDIGAQDIVQQQDGKLVICGVWLEKDVDGEGGKEYSLVARYNEDGSIDKDFANNGQAILTTLYFLPYSVALQSNGKIVCGGNADLRSYGSLVRYNTDGNLDKTFGIDGIVKSRFSKKGLDYYNDIVIGEDDKIIAAGTAQDQAFNGTQPVIAVARYNPDGVLDETFDKDGKDTLSLAVYTQGKSVTLQPDNKIIISALAANNGADFGVVRLNVDGSIDSAFGTEGKTVTAIADNTQDEPYQVALQSTGDIIVSGVSVNENNEYSSVLARYIGGSKENSLPITKIKSWLRQHAVQWQPIYSSGNIDFYAIEKSKSYSGSFTEVKRYEAEALPQPLVTDQTITYAYNLATDATANAATASYYRIRAVYNNGSSVYSDVVSDSLLIQNNTLTIYPNPVKNELRLTGIPSGKQATIHLLNRNGNVLSTAYTSSSVYTKNVSSLRSGVYYLQVIIDGKTQTRRFIKE